MLLISCHPCMNTYPETDSYIQIERGAKRN
jgi:hypothetical protein